MVLHRPIESTPFTKTWRGCGDRLLSKMQIDNHGCVVELARLTWPVALQIPMGRFRLFVAADTTATTTEALADFAYTSLKRGMVYFCAWGPSCKRFHDIVDEVIVEDALGERQFAGPKVGNDTVMTTWHERDTLDEALDYFLISACPTDGFIADSNYWVAMCVNNPIRAAIIRQRLEGVDLSLLG
jgi:hypothetical protein